MSWRHAGHCLLVYDDDGGLEREVYISTAWSVRKDCNAPPGSGEGSVLSEGISSLKARNTNTVVVVLHIQCACIYSILLKCAILRDTSGKRSF